MTDAQKAQLTDPSGLVNQIIGDTEENSVDEYLDGLDGPSEAEIAMMSAESDLNNEEIE